MSPMLKKVIAAVAIKEGIEKVQEMRRPKPSLWSRLSPVVLVAAVGGALFYLNKSGRLGGVGGVKDKLGEVKDKAGGGSSNGSGSWDSGSPTTAPTTTGV